MELRMKRFHLFSATMLALAACNQPATQPLATSAASPANLAGCPGGMDRAACEAYKDGITAGKSDKTARLSAEYKRHEGQYDGALEAPFRQGYATGWYNDGR
jgi:hypothetical protein